MDAPLTIFTVGHSVRPADEFLALLRAHGIERIADVRRWPRSRRHPHFSADALAASLAAAGIAYLHVVELGGMREPRADSVNLALPDGPFRGYADHMEGGEFALGLERLLEFARGGRTAVMCAEALPAHCHRRLLADALVARGIAVTHLLAADRSEPHRPSPGAVLEAGRAHYPRRDLFS